MLGPEAPPPSDAALEGLPVLGICGWSGCGKTTLLEGLVAALVREGLRVGVVKHDVHGIAVDPGDKDSDRLFRAGADVLLQGPGESLTRSRLPGEPGLSGPCPAAVIGGIAELAARSDLVLVEGHKKLPVPKVWLLDAAGRGPPPDVTGVLASLPRDGDRAAAALPIARALLERRLRETPLWGCALIGGKSTRMGSPKHLLRAEDAGPEGGRAGRTWIERTVGLLRAVCGRVVIAGAGAVPEPLSALSRLPDVPGVEGPLAGVLAAMRWAPRVSWIVAACDLPRLTREALDWLAATRRPGVWATIPRRESEGAPEPLLAAYDFRARGLLEDLAASRRFGLAALAGNPKVQLAPVPEDLAPAWGDADTPADLSRGATPARPRAVPSRAPGPGAAPPGGRRSGRPGP